MVWAVDIGEEVVISFHRLAMRQVKPLNFLKIIMQFQEQLVLSHIRLVLPDHWDCVPSVLEGEEDVSIDEDEQLVQDEDALVDLVELVDQDLQLDEDDVVEVTS